MTRSALSEIEDYLLGRIAKLETMIKPYPKEEVTHTTARIAEAKETLKKVREIKGKRK